LKTLVYCGQNSNDRRVTLIEIEPEGEERRAFDDKQSVSFIKAK